MKPIGFHDPLWQAALRWLCSVLSYSIFIISFCYKAPQVYAVVHSGSSLGISMGSLLLEFSSYSIEMTYQFGMGYLFETYFEITLMWFQDVILLWVVIVNRHLLSWSLLPPLAVYLMIFATVAMHWFPDAIMYTLVSTSIPIIILSKATQLWKVLSTKNPGSLSALTWGLLAYLAGARILTTLVITGDLPMLVNTTSATFLNVSITTSILYYNHLKAQKRTRRRLSGRGRRRRSR